MNSMLNLPSLRVRHLLLYLLYFGVLLEVSNGTIVTDKSVEVTDVSSIEGITHVFNSTFNPRYPLVHLGTPLEITLSVEHRRNAGSQPNVTSSMSRSRGVAEVDVTGQPRDLIVSCTSEDDRVFTVMDVDIKESAMTQEVTKQEVTTQSSTDHQFEETLVLEATVRLRGHGIGQKQLNCELLTEDGKVETTFFTFVTVSRQVGLFEFVFRLTANLVIIILSLMMGCQIDVQVVKDSLSRPLAPAIGFFCQFLCMPLISLTVIYIFGLSGAFAFGLFTLGCAPGGGNSNFLTLLFDGNVSLSITMTFISNMAALFMMPAWLMTIGDHLLNGSARKGITSIPMDTFSTIGVSLGVVGNTVKIPFVHIIASILVNTIPLVIGVTLAKLKPKIADKLKSCLRPMILVTLLFFFGCSLYMNIALIKIITLKLVMVCCSVPYAGFLIGFLISKITCRPIEDVVCISFETGIQNIGIAFVIVINTLPHPQEDMALLALIIIAMISPLPIYLAILIRSLQKYKFARKEHIELSKNDGAIIINKGTNEGKKSQDIECKYTTVGQV